MSFDTDRGIEMTVKTVARPRGHPGYSETLPCAAESAKIARRLIGAAVCAWGMEALADDGALVVTELVANAAQHTKSRLIRVVIIRPALDTVRIEVVDRSPTLPLALCPETDDLRGHGLALVDDVTKQWGTERLPWGKRVWGVLTCEAGQ
ncbi:ATP-binding protein [Streptomyces sp. NPDC087270]|uniref:ATP-binding protein n=1 Tax=Streptomyces sp. NPDC087270 TaxID=3365774 RepID=UPI003809CB7F